MTTDYTLELRSLTIVDADGRPRIRLGVSDLGAAVLEMLDGHG